MTFRVGRAASLVALGLFAATVAQPEPAPPRVVTLTTAQAQILARDAYAAGDHALARALAVRLLEADPNDPRALLIVTATAPALGDPARGRSAGRAAWAAAKGAPLLRYEIARHTARAALSEGKPEMAQLWLRRAVDVAPDAAAVSRTAEDHRRIAAQRRFSWKIDLAVTPTSNLNGGASGDSLTVNGTLPIGSLSGAAQALSGVRGSAQVRLAWKLPPGPRHRAEASLRLYSTANQLSSEARALAPEARGSDFDFSTVEAALALDWAALPQARPVRLTFGGGRSWFGGAALGPHLRVGVDYPLITRADAALRVGLTGERQWRSGGQIDAAVLRLDGGRHMAGGGRVMFGASFRDVSGSNANATFRAAGVEVAWTPVQPLAGAEITLRASAGWRGHDFYTLGPIGLTDGRQDRTLGLTVEATLPSLSMMGYAPRIALQGERVRSNVSRFDTRTLALTVGVASRF
ncbi:MAG: hypothetical protein ACK4L4_14775 [Gemmobacter sp.]